MSCICHCPECPQCYYPVCAYPVLTALVLCRDLEELMSCLTSPCYQGRRKQLDRFVPLLDLFARPQLFNTARFDTYTYCPNTPDSARDTAALEDRYVCHLSLCHPPTGPAWWCVTVDKGEVKVNCVVQTFNTPGSVVTGEAGCGWFVLSSRHV